ncbi:TRAP transporter small permease [Grimontia hollisae]|uniref:TRAP transporter small permease protein n=2 Tax=Grimontia hollisae TaxID=673 RepID=D0IB92_GRIHO|nr:TRAP transporter small permease [Grimontia hollisae]AMG32084.1 TRAP transporter small permease [Grimontia hollisae]EEY71160.1 TRAP dicarboxylate transporter DctQ subunit [Grimontia hollisae CIP 101886]MDF2186482.1 TRAP transporter small permease [Grimontia hollisae]STO43945.1 TRAP-type C4-dicarboxylate transport system, small permease component [Grimontia hollisae]STO57167.1 TRAP-type C4-dicarboxylate transport system, small permease component [Grimontia hollisae]
MRLLYALMQWLDENTEKVIILITYSTMAGIIFVEVVRRFLFNEQVAWSTTIPVLLFLWVTWFGASYNIKKRTHLALTEIRARLSYRLQFLCLILDAVLWIVFAGIVIFHATNQVWIAYDNFAIVGGTDDVMEWWFYLATPLAWGLIVIRVIQNLAKDIQTFKRREPFVLQASLVD